MSISLNLFAEFFRIRQTPLQLYKEGKKEREDGEKGGGGRLFERGDYLKYFRLRVGDYSMEAINQGNTVLEKRRRDRKYVLRSTATVQGTNAK